MRVTENITIGVNVIMILLGMAAVFYVPELPIKPGSLEWSLFVGLAVGFMAIGVREVAAAVIHPALFEKYGGLITTVVVVLSTGVLLLASVGAWYLLLEAPSVW